MFIWKILATLNYPIISPTGYTYEKETIFKWLDKKNICPFTKIAMYKEDLRINRNLLDIIHFIVLKEKYNNKYILNPINFEEILH